MRNSVGGVARNIAENLARLEVPTILLSAVGQDLRRLRPGVHGSCRRGYELRPAPAPDEHGGYAAIFDATGQLVVSISEYDIVSQITPGYVQRCRTLFAEASLVALDVNLSPRTLDSVFRWARRYGVPVCADPPASPGDQAHPHLPDLMMVALTRARRCWCGAAEVPETSAAAIETAQRLVSMGVDIAVVTMPSKGLAYADGSSAGHIAALRAQV